MNAHDRAMTKNPDATLTELRNGASRILHIEDMTGDNAKAAALIHDHAVRLAEDVEAIDKWLCRGGFLPQDWRRRKRP